MADLIERIEARADAASAPFRYCRQGASWWVCPCRQWTLVQDSSESFYCRKCGRDWTIDQAQPVVDLSEPVAVESRP